MGKLKPILGYTWAVAAVFIVLATFLGNAYFSRELASATGVTVSARITGGEVVQVSDHGPYKVLVHRPVFDGLLGDRSTGFIQINWEGAGGLPPVVEERVELGGKRPVRLLVRLDTRAGEAAARDFAGARLPVESVYKLPSGWAVRVLLTSR
jgi:hypothetical protein